jgi:hypothetical protein
MESRFGSWASKLAAAAIACLWFGPAVAAPESIPARKITSIQAYGKGAAIHFPSYTNAQGCVGAQATNTVFIDFAASPDLKSPFAAVLAAYLSGKSVGFGIDGCYAGYGGGVPTVYRVDVED